MSKKALLDTNILIYAHDSDSPFFEKASLFLREQTTSGNLCFSNQNIIEAYRIWTQKLKKPISAKQAWKIVDYYENIGVQIIYPTQKSLSYLRSMSHIYTIAGVHIFDAQLVATMMEHEITKLYTVNTKDFLQYREIEVVNPLHEEKV